jgi:hypothetical protein
MAPKAPKKPKKKSDIKKTSAAMDAMVAIAPHLQDIINYGVHGTAAAGAGALGYMGNKARKMRKRHDKELKEMGYEKGGEAVPKKFKGFSKLPEAVQQNMDSGLANKYRYGGEARNSGSQGSCRGMGSAMRGGSFSGVK